MTTEELAELLHDSTCICKLARHNTHHYAEFEAMAAAILARYDLIPKGEGSENKAVVFAEAGQFIAAWLGGDIAAQGPTPQDAVAALDLNIRAQAMCDQFHDKGPFEDVPPSPYALLALPAAPQKVPGGSLND